MALPKIVKSRFSLILCRMNYCAFVYWKYLSNVVHFYNREFSLFFLCITILNCVCIDLYYITIVQFDWINSNMPSYSYISNSDPEMLSIYVHKIHFYGVALLLHKSLWSKFKDFGCVLCGLEKNDYLCIKQIS